MSISINIGMWFERFVIIVTSTHRDFIPSAWTYYKPSWVEVGVFLFTFGFFLCAFLLFARAVPVVAIAEVKAIFKSSSETHKKKRALKDSEEEEYKQLVEAQHKAEHLVVDDES